MQCLLLHGLSAKGYLAVWQTTTPDLAGCTVLVMEPSPFNPKLRHGWALKNCCDENSDYDASSRVTLLTRCLSFSSKPAWTRKRVVAIPSAALGEAGL